MTISNPHSLAVLEKEKKRIIREATSDSKRNNTKTYVFENNSKTHWLYRNWTDPRDVGNIKEFRQNYSIIAIYENGFEQKNPFDQQSKKKRTQGMER